MIYDKRFMVNISLMAVEAHMIIIGTNLLDIMMLNKP